MAYFFIHLSESLWKRLLPYPSSLSSPKLVTSAGLCSMGIFVCVLDNWDVWRESLDLFGSLPAHGKLLQSGDWLWSSLNGTITFKLLFTPREVWVYRLWFALFIVWSGEEIPEVLYLISLTVPQSAQSSKLCEILGLFVSS